MKRMAGVFAIAVVLALASGVAVKTQSTARQAVDKDGAPMFKVDPFWPKPLPNKWGMQQVTGIGIDPSNDHVWFLNRAAAANPDETGGATAASSAASRDRS